jgi:hypothetical protein
MHEPNDSTLLWDAVRVLSRLPARIAAPCAIRAALREAVAQIARHQAQQGGLYPSPAVQIANWLPIGKLRMRLPVAAKIALQRAGAKGGKGGSPTRLRLLGSCSRVCRQLLQGCT